MQNIGGFNMFCILNPHPHNMFCILNPYEEWGWEFNMQNIL
jgi:hypothetical protein